MQRQASLLVQSPMSWYALAFAYILGLMAQYIALPSLLCLALLFFIILQGNSKNKKYLFLFSALFYIVASILPSQTASYKQDYTKSFINNEQHYSAHIDTVQSLTDKRLRLIISDIQSSHGLQDRQKINKRAVVYLHLENEQARESLKTLPLVGMKILFNASFRPVSFPVNDGITDASLYWKSMDVFYSAYLSPQKNTLEFIGKGNYLARLRQKIYNAFLNKCMENGEISQARAILIALIFGERFYIDSSTYTLFAKASLVHSIALSGMHLFFAFLLALAIVKILTFIFPYIYEVFPQKILIAFFSLPLALLYFWIGNAPLSLLRASLMLLFFTLYLFMYKKLSLLDCLVLTAFVILLFMPSAIIHLGFQFSVLSVLAIALFAPYFSHFSSHFFYNKVQQFPFKSLSLRRKILLSILNLFYISFVIQIFLFPLQASVFGIVSPYFFLNVLWLPLLQLLILPLAFLTLFTLYFSQFSSLLLSLSSSLVELCLFILYTLENKELINSIQSYRLDIWQSIGYYLLILTFFYWKRLNFHLVYILISLLCLFSFPLYKVYDNFKAQNEERITLRVLAVGQGQSVLIEHAGKNFLVDAGGVFGNRFDTGRDTISKVLSYRAFPKIEKAFITHFDLDHAKGFFHILKHIDTKTLYYSALDNQKEMRKELLLLAENQEVISIPLHAGHIVELIPNILFAHILSPDLDSEFSKSNYSNNTSLVIRLVHRNKGIALICGDIENEGIENLLSKDLSLQAELLILPHHGAQNGYSEEFYARVSPLEVVASTALFNRFNFPSSKIIDYFTAKNIEVKNTAIDNDVKYFFKK